MRGVYISTREQYNLQTHSKAQEVRSIDQLDVGD